MVLIDSLFIMDQFKAAERMTIGNPHTKDIAEVTAVAEAVLPKGSARVSPTVRHRAAPRGRCLGEAEKRPRLPCNCSRCRGWLSGRANAALASLGLLCGPPVGPLND